MNARTRRIIEDAVRAPGRDWRFWICLAVAVLSLNAVVTIAVTWNEKNQAEQKIDTLEGGQICRSQANADVLAGMATILIAKGRNEVLVNQALVQVALDDPTFDLEQLAADLDAQADVVLTDAALLEQAIAQLQRAVNECGNAAELIENGDTEPSNTTLEETP